MDGDGDEDGEISVSSRCLVGWHLTSGVSCSLHKILIFEQILCMMDTLFVIVGLQLGLSDARGIRPALWHWAGRH
jgi:hypothetical protein